MLLKAKPTAWQKVDSDTVVFFVSETAWKKELGELDRTFFSSVILHAEVQGFTGGFGKFFSYPVVDKTKVRRILLAGTGKSADLNTYRIRKVAALLVKQVRALGSVNLALCLTSEPASTLKTADLVAALTEGLLLGSYRFQKYQENRKDEKLVEVWYLVSAARLELAAQTIERGKLFSQATNYARDLINEPPSLTTPTYLAHEAKKLVKKGIAVEILDKKQIEKLGMNSYLSVSRGSDEAPKFIKLTYKAGRQRVVIAGKAITFDTGGLSLKDSKNMETMKLDMAGAASVLGIFSVLVALKPNVTVTGLIAATENMPGPKATKPGDIVKAFNGKTIEILNTDAEGRLTLADVLSYAVTLRPEVIIDLATLTGACMVALGEEIAGVWSNNSQLTANLQKSAEQAGEKIWPMPLEDEYRDLVKSDVADLRNIAKNRYGGAVTAALFLEEFVDKTAWAHFDIAGPAFEEKETPVNPKGGVGFGVRLLLNWLKSF